LFRFRRYLHPHKLDRTWAVGGRIGYVALPGFLTYVNGGYTEARFDTTDLRALPDDEAARAHAEKVADDFARTKLFGTAVRVTNDPGQVVCRSIVDASSSKEKRETAACGLATASLAHSRASERQGVGPGW
jgi:Domain of unknown function (DUF6894)